MIRAPVCFECQLENVFAIEGGPTCRHHENNGMKYWPEDWSKMPEDKRIEWLEKKQLANSQQKPICQKV